MAGQKWEVDAEGGFLANPELSEKLRHFAQPMMRFAQFVRPEPGFGKQKGESIDFDKITDIETAASLTGIAETSVMPESRWQVIKSALTVTEWGNSIPYTGKLEDLAEFDPSNVTQRVLRNDQARTLDQVIAGYFKASKVAYTAQGTVNAPTGTFFQGTDTSPVNLTASRNMQMFDVESIVDYMKDTLFVPPYDGENYVCIASNRALRGIKNDQKFIDAAHFGDPDRLFRSEVGMIESCRFVEDTDPLALSRFGGSNVAGEAVFFGEDPVVEGIAVPPEVRAKIPTDYGRSKGLAWYALMGWATPWRYTATETQARIVWFDSDDNTLEPPTGY